MIHLNEAGIQITERTLKERLRLLWRVFMYVVKPNVYYGVNQELDNFGRIVVSGWIRKPGDADFKYHYVNYDGKEAPTGFVDGIALKPGVPDNVQLLGRVLDGCCKNIGSPAQQKVGHDSHQDEPWS